MDGKTFQNEFRLLEKKLDDIRIQRAVVAYDLADLDVQIAEVEAQVESYRKALGFK